MKQLLFILFTLLVPSMAFASDALHQSIDLTSHWIGYTAIAIFVLAYTLVILEEQLHLRKSKPVLVAAGIIWLIIGWIYTQNGGIKTIIYTDVLQTTFMLGAVVFAVVAIGNALGVGVTGIPELVADSNY